MLANPKIAAFMIAFYPQFVPADRPLFATTALFAALQVAIEIVLYLTLAAAVGRGGGVVPPPGDPAPARRDQRDRPGRPGRTTGGREPLRPGSHT